MYLDQLLCACSTQKLVKIHYTIDCKVIWALFSQIFQLKSNSTGSSRINFFQWLCINDPIIIIIFCIKQRHYFLSNKKVGLPDLITDTHVSWITIFSFDLKMLRYEFLSNFFGWILLIRDISLMNSCLHSFLIW